MWFCAWLITSFYALDKCSVCSHPARSSALFTVNTRAFSRSAFSVCALRTLYFMNLIICKVVLSHSSFVWTFESPPLFSILLLCTKYHTAHAIRLILVIIHANIRASLGELREIRVNLAKIHENSVSERNVRIYADFHSMLPFASIVPVYS